MTIVVTGGGSGGHITPILAVASELKRQARGIRVVYIGQKGDSLADIPANDPNIDAVYSVRAGKFRRYHGEGWKQLLDIATQAKNVRDGLFVLIGIWQSFWLLKRLKPAIIFTRGGFVSVPVALAAVPLRIPFITHDSDSVPSLANRIIARWARLHAVALPPEAYPYPPAKTKMVGIPLNGGYTSVTLAMQVDYRKQIGLEAYARVLLVTGGGNGAKQLNETVIANIKPLLKQYADLAVIHFAGRSLENEVSDTYDALLSAIDRRRIRVFGFVSDFYRYSGAADVIIARGGATNLAEFAIQGKACIIVPADQLVGDHQTKNTTYLAKHHAVVMLSQEQSEQDRRLAHAVADLLNDQQARTRLGRNFSQYARPDAAHELAVLLLDQAKKDKQS